MKTTKRNKLEAKGWKVGSTANFLKLSDEAAAYIELKIKLAKHLQPARTRRDMN